MTERAVLYQLTHKFVNTERDIPAAAHQVIYYALAIGHHVGVVDCLQPLAELPLEAYAAWVARLPAGPARHKLEGLLKWGEIEINASHAGDLLAALEPAPGQPAPEAAWAGALAQSLRQMRAEPALYLMVRTRP
jgi:hypothetical protein